MGTFYTVAGRRRTCGHPQPGPSLAQAGWRPFSRTSALTRLVSCFPTGFLAPASSRGGRGGFLWHHRGGSPLRTGHPTVPTSRHHHVGGRISTYESEGIQDVQSVAAMTEELETKSKHAWISAQSQGQVRFFMWHLKCFRVWPDAPLHVTRAPATPFLCEFLSVSLVSLFPPVPSANR